MGITIPSRALRRGRVRRAALGLASVLLALACARPHAEPATDTATLDPVRVRIGTIDKAELESMHLGAPQKVPERTEQIVDLFWQVGCFGDDLYVSKLDYQHSPDVLCSLPGRTPSTILVAAHLDGKARKREAPEDWAGTALLPSLYRALRVEPRQHSFVFAALGEMDHDHGYQPYLERLDPAQRAQVRAIVDLREVANPVLWSASKDLALRMDLVAVVRSLGRPPETLRFFDPGHTRPPVKKNVPKLNFDKENPPREEESRPSKVPAISLGGTQQTRKLEKARHKAASQGSHSVSAKPPRASDDDYYTTARVIALYLGYLDETLRLRSEPPEAQAAGLPTASDAIATPLVAPEP